MRTKDLFLPYGFTREQAAAVIRQAERDVAQAKTPDAKGFAELYLREWREIAAGNGVLLIDGPWDQRWFVPSPSAHTFIPEPGGAYRRPADGGDTWQWFADGPSDGLTDLPVVPLAGLHCDEHPCPHEEREPDVCEECGNVLCTCRRAA